MKQRLEDLEDEIKTLKRRHANNVKVIFINLLLKWLFPFSLQSYANSTSRSDLGIIVIFNLGFMSMVILPFVL